MNDYNHAWPGITESFMGREVKICKTRQMDWPLTGGECAQGSALKDVWRLLHWLEGRMLDSFDGC
jgi:hypothetical protein